MRLYAFLVLPLFALAARAATIPDNTQVDQESLQKSQEDFITQIDTLTGKIETFINGRSNVSPADEQMKTDLQIIETDLKTIKNMIITTAKTDENPEEASSDAAPVNPETRSQTFITTFQNDVQNGSAEITNSISNIVIGEPNLTTDPDTTAEALAPPQPEIIETPEPPQLASTENQTPPEAASAEAAVPSQPAGAQADNPSGPNLTQIQQWFSFYKPVMEQMISQYQQIANNTNIQTNVEKFTTNVSQVAQNFNPQTIIAGAGGGSGSTPAGGSSRSGAAGNTKPGQLDEPKP